MEVLNLLKSNKIKSPKILLITGKSSLQKSGYITKFKNIFENSNIRFELYNKAGFEPTATILNEGKQLAIDIKCDVIIGVGGGSAMDTAKGIAGLVTNGGILEDYHAGKEFIKPPLPFILIPTTSGTGSEVTNNAVIKDEKKGIKQSVRGLYANEALLDPELTLSLPKDFTAYPGADALVQAIESLVSRGSNYITDFFAKESITYLGVTLPKVCDELDNIDLREKMMLGSFLGAISFANGKLGAVHGFAHPIGIKHNISHGLICGLLLPYVMEYNVALKSVVEKYAWIAELFHSQQILTDYGECSKNLPEKKGEKAKWAIEKIKDLFQYIGIPLHLSDVGIKEYDLDDIVSDTTGSSLDNNPRSTDKNSLKKILLSAL
jgi:alcohol dehydrogenase class IV